MKKGKKKKRKRKRMEMSRVMIDDDEVIHTVESAEAEG